MVNSESTGKRRARRATLVSQQLERARARNSAQLAEERKRQEQVDRGLLDYFAKNAEIKAAEAARDAKIAQLEEKTAAIRAEHDRRVEGVRAEMARVAFAIHTAGKTVGQVAELLDVPAKSARALIGRGRKAASAGRAGSAPSRGFGSRGRRGGAVPAGSASSPVHEPAAAAGSGEQCDLRGVDGQHNGANGGLVPSVGVDRGGQSA